MSKSKKKNAVKKFCFVLMPCNTNFDDVYELGIRAACDEAGTYCERVDEQYFQGNMVERIYNQIAKADIIIADMSGPNANVFFEAGYARALNKVLIFLADNDKFPFDLSQYTHIVYDRKHLADLRYELVKRVEHFARENIESGRDTKSFLDVAIDPPRLNRFDERNTTGICATMSYRLTNTSLRKVTADDYRAIVLLPEPAGIFFEHGDEYNHFSMPDGTICCELPHPGPLFPNSPVKTGIQLVVPDGTPEVTITLRISTWDGDEAFEHTIRLSELPPSPTQ